MARAKNPIGAVQRSLDIIDILQERGESSIGEIAEQIGLTKGTTHSHLSTLQEYGYVVKQDDRYRLGLRFLDVAHSCQNSINIYDIVKTEVDKLAQESGEIVLFSVEENDELVVLYKSEGENAVQTEGYAGFRNDLYRTAAGKVMLANMPNKKQERIIQQTEFEQQTPHTITNERELRDTIEQIQEDGIGYNLEESIQGLIGVSAPISDQDGSVVGAISIMGPARRMTEDRVETKLLDMIYRSINIIEINMMSL